jgi:hypothetical protein
VSAHNRERREYRDHLRAGVRRGDLPAFAQTRIGRKGKSKIARAEDDRRIALVAFAALHRREETDG